MITVIVEFKLPEVASKEQARETFLSTAPRYRGMQGLVRKYYFLSEDGTKAGGVYLWESRKDAEAMYTQEWRDFVRAKYGTDPSVTYLDCLVVVDNVSNEIIEG
jgi:hypothetical protein